jgi:hypothetical protein
VLDCGARNGNSKADTGITEEMVVKTLRRGKRMREVGEVFKQTRMQIEKNKCRKHKKKLRKEMHTVRKKKRGRK